LGSQTKKLRDTVEAGKEKGKKKKKKHNRQPRRSHSEDLREAGGSNSTREDGATNEPDISTKLRRSAETLVRYRLRGAEKERNGFRERNPERVAHRGHYVGGNTEVI